MSIFSFYFLFSFLVHSFYISTFLHVYILHLAPSLHSSLQVPFLNYLLFRERKRGKGGKGEQRGGSDHLHRSANTNESTNTNTDYRLQIMEYSIHVDYVASLTLSPHVSVYR